MSDEAAKAHYDAINDASPNWLRDSRSWYELPDDIKDHHREVARRVIDALGNRVPVDSVKRVPFSFDRTNS